MKSLIAEFFQFSSAFAKFLVLEVGLSTRLHQHSILIIPKKFLFSNIKILSRSASREAIRSDNNPAVSIVVKGN